MTGTDCVQGAKQALRDWAAQNKMAITTMVDENGKVHMNLENVDNGVSVTIVALYED